MIFIILYIYQVAQNKSNLYLSPEWHFFLFVSCAHTNTSFVIDGVVGKGEKKKILVKIIYFSHVTFKLFVFSSKKRLFVFYLVVI